MSALAGAREGVYFRVCLHERVRMCVGGCAYVCVFGCGHWRRVCLRVCTHV